MYRVDAATHACFYLCTYACPFIRAHRRNQREDDLVDSDWEDMYVHISRSGVEESARRWIYCGYLKAKKHSKMAVSVYIHMHVQMYVYIYICLRVRMSGRRGRSRQIH